uniref:PHD-type domain-containing protein n=1 Tax=Nyssomyia neivai TaxID=330878 RepID=A0A1L8D836_9DIPT
MPSRHSCAVCHAAVDRKSAPGFPCSGACDSRYHANCVVPPVPLADVDDIMIGRTQWFCPGCTAGSTADDGTVEGSSSVSIVELIARIERAEAHIEAQSQEILLLRTMLAESDVRSRVRALELRLDAQAFWSMTSARTSLGGAGAASLTRRAINAAATLRPPVTSSPIGRSVIRRSPEDLMGYEALSPVGNSDVRVNAPRKKVQINPIPTAELTLLDIDLNDPTNGDGNNTAAPGNNSQHSREPSWRDLPTWRPSDAGATSLTNTQCASGSGTDTRVPSAPLSGANSMPVGSDGVDGRASSDRRTQLTRCNSSAVVDFVADPEPRLKWAFATGFRPLTSPEVLLEFIDKTLGQKIDARCLKLTPPERTYASFRLGLPQEIYATVVSETFWPKGISVKDFQFPRSLRGRGNFRPRAHRPYMERQHLDQQDLEQKPAPMSDGTPSQSTAAVDPPV